MQLLTRAHAKVNLTLDVLGRRPDGYHEVQMVMTTLALADTLVVSPGAGALVVTAAAAGVPSGPENLVYRAALLLRAAAGRPEARAHIAIQKRIPAAAGLGGGSADAAAALLALNRLWGLALPAEQLAQIALRLGADVPFCLTGGTMLAEGIGERLSPLPPAPAVPVVVATPQVAWPGPKTATVYRAYRAEAVARRPRLAAMTAALAAGDAAAVALELGNALEPAATGIHPVIGDLKAAMLAAGALGAVMAGAGPSVLALCATPAAAAQVAAAARRVTPLVVVTELKGHA